MTARDKAPDGAPWPLPRVARDSREQRAWMFGLHPDEDSMSPGVPDKNSLVNELLGGPWQTERRTLPEADYALLAPDGGVLEGVCGVERKSIADLRGSLSTGHDRLMAEMMRLSAWTTPLLVVEAPVEVLIGDRSGLVRALEYARAALTGAANTVLRLGDEANGEIVGDAAAWVAEQLGHAPDDVLRPGRVSVRALLGSVLSITTDHRIPTLFLPSRAWAEYAAAWVLRRAWRRWLTDHPEGLAQERARLAAIAA